MGGARCGRNRSAYRATRSVDCATSEVFSKSEIVSKSSRLSTSRISCAFTSRVRARFNFSIQENFQSPHILGVFSNPMCGSRSHVWKRQRG
ncbi:hypothetical protein NPIL_368861 [Nephila pilipes]|uniref:Uncharacterized protein n=1 Tax=Nephila pilipes TaxID=299642 RepID=A0A8X6NTM5_NEPPI|nr:hypothetical protein NPIL_368861 [Nephila pilipes]